MREEITAEHHVVEHAKVLMQALRESAAQHVILVSNEVGSGIIPIERQARLFADCQGRLNQYLGQSCDETYWCVAGFAVNLRDVGKSIC